MKIVNGDLWSYSETHWITIPVNVGWNTRGENIMGAGVAKQAKERCPDLAKWFGGICSSFREKTPVILYTDQSKLDTFRYYVLFPTKSLNEKAPHLSWRSASSLDFVKKSIDQLAEMGANRNGPGSRTLGTREVVLPLIGCGFGGLSPDDVVPLLENALDDSFTLVVQ